MARLHLPVAQQVWGLRPTLPGAPPAPHSAQKPRKKRPEVPEKGKRSVAGSVQKAGRPIAETEQREDPKERGPGPCARGHRVHESVSPWLYPCGKLDRCALPLAVWWLCGGCAVGGGGRSCFCLCSRAPSSSKCLPAPSRWTSTCAAVSSLSRTGLAPAVGGPSFSSLSLPWLPPAARAIACDPCTTHSMTVHPRLPRLHLWPHLWECSRGWP